MLGLLLHALLVVTPGLADSTIFKNNFEEHGIIPDVIRKLPQSQLEVTLQPDKTAVKTADTVSPTQLITMPKFKWAAQPGKMYSLFILNPDVPSRRNAYEAEWQHLSVFNIPDTGNVMSGDQVVAYNPTYEHEEAAGIQRIVVLVFEQTRKVDLANVIHFAKDEVRKKSGESRAAFHIKPFINKVKLVETPVAGDFFYVALNANKPTTEKEKNGSIVNLGTKGQQCRSKDDCQMKFVCLKGVCSHAAALHNMDEKPQPEDSSHKASDPEEDDYTDVTNQFSEDGEYMRQQAKNQAEDQKGLKKDSLFADDVADHQDEPPGDDPQQSISTRHSGDASGTAASEERTTSAAPSKKRISKLKQSPEINGKLDKYYDPHSKDPDEASYEELLEGEDKDLLTTIPWPSSGTTITTATGESVLTTPADSPTTEGFVYYEYDTNEKDQLQVKKKILLDANGTESSQAENRNTTDEYPDSSLDAIPDLSSVTPTMITSAPLPPSVSLTRLLNTTGSRKKYQVPPEKNLLGFFKYPEDCNRNAPTDCDFLLNWYKSSGHNELTFTMMIKNANSTALGFSYNMSLPGSDVIYVSGDGRIRDMHINAKNEVVEDLSKNLISSFVEQDGRMLNVVVTKQFNSDDTQHDVDLSRPEGLYFFIDTSFLGSSNLFYFLPNKIHLRPFFSINLARKTARQFAKEPADLLTDHGPPPGPQHVNCRSPGNEGKRFVSSWPGMSSTYLLCSGGVLQLKKCPASSLFYFLLQCCVALNKYPCLHNCLLDPDVAVVTNDATHFRYPPAQTMDEPNAMV